MRRAAAGAGRLLLEQAERQLEVELRVLVRLVEGQRASELSRREEQEAQSLPGVVRRGEREAEDPQQVGSLRAPRLVLPLTDVRRERDGRLAPDLVDVRVLPLVRTRLREVEVPERLPVEEVVLDSEEPLRDVERDELVRLPEVGARGLEAVAHVVPRECRVPAPDVDC